MANPDSVVVVGGGLAGAKTVEQLRDRGYGGPLTLLANEPHLPYERPPLSKGYLGGTAERSSVFVHSAEWYSTNNVDLRMGTGVTQLDTVTKQVALSDGSLLDYDIIVLATGSSPRRLDLPGADASGVLTLRTLDDSDRLRQAIAESSGLAIIGAGWIGLEAAAAARNAGVPTTVLEAADLPLVRVLGPEVAEVFAQLHREHGVDLRTSVQVEQILLEDGSVSGVRLADGATVSVDTVLIGVGITPNVSLAEDGGLPVDNGVVVDAGLRTEDPSVYAVGDVANAWHPTLARHLRVEHWANALNQPSVAAANILGESAVYDRLPYFFTDQYDLGMEYVGYAEPGEYDEVVFRGDVAGRAFIAFWLRQGRVLAGMNVNVWDVSEAVKTLIASQKPVDRRQLGDPSVPLDEIQRM
jgi:3-phenylpropionate/trans-cinnamate dioxygenase ferredoxin reductase component